ncbi:hypothetical protein EDWATA_03716 [Edwardsiella tarda ATCC 23685]|uniref:Uncharacterized protein n=1 Tax=Edwardsiella tarda ATCC 23685 TaxID=500638 RepID=D4FA99_EDWTA|nr:hypothetical protein EDWATA_03716 [Edwardsiella tarda ATCC 23685]
MHGVLPKAESPALVCISVCVIRLSPARIARARVAIYCQKTRFIQTADNGLYSSLNCYKGYLSYGYARSATSSRQLFARGGKMR